MDSTKNNLLVIAVVAIVALFLGALIGNAVGSGEVTPEICVTALDDAETTQQLAGTGFYQVSDIIGAMEYGDYYAAERIAMEFSETAEQVVEAMDEYHESAAACRALADS